jgi:hypothetical protein
MRVFRQAFPIHFVLSQFTPKHQLVSHSSFDEPKPGKSNFEGQHRIFHIGIEMGVIHPVLNCSVSFHNFAPRLCPYLKRINGLAVV